MSKVLIHPAPLVPHPGSKNPLPQLLHTPSGLALLEMQGTINLPSHNDQDSMATEPPSDAMTKETPIGRLIFPGYDPESPGDMAWMKRVYLKP
ncbi:sister chromatid cohesion protein Ctf8 [Diplocarpon rosae]|nr:sister chromatid cohesion protein Ctf8 [Diplocarpon rosae]